MGQISIETYGSFPNHNIRFPAQTHGHAHAVNEAIKFLVNEILPEAINADHHLQSQGAYPDNGFYK